MPHLAQMLREGPNSDMGKLVSAGKRLLTLKALPDSPDDLPSLAIWAQGSYPLARIFHVSGAGDRLQAWVAC